MVLSPLFATYANFDTPTTTVSVAVAVGVGNELSVAVITLDPTASPVPISVPFVGPATIVAIAGVPELYVTGFEGTCVELSLHTSIAVNTAAPPIATEGVAGVTCSETGTGTPVVSTAVPEMPYSVAVIVALPVDATEVAKPVLSIVATAVFDDDHDASEVTSVVPVLPSGFVNVPVAVYCCVVPLETVAVAGVTTILVNWFTFNVAVAGDVPAAVPMIVTVPGAIPVATPKPVMVATAALDEDQLTRLVPSLTVPSL